MSLAPLSNLRSKLNDLDDILDCPVCFNRLSGDILQCTNGHSVCRKCQGQILKCPLCKSKFYGSRNYLAESIIKKFEEVKDAVTNLNNNIQCFTGAVPKPSFKAAITYPCGVPDCERTLSYKDMISHLSKDHNDILEAGFINSNKFTDWWTLPYDYGIDWYRIVHIQNIGIFFIEVTVSKKGNFYGCVTNVNNLQNAQFYYKLEVDHPYRHDLYFDGPVVSTTVSQNKGQYLHIGGAVYEDDDEDDCFDINLEIIRVQ